MVGLSSDQLWKVLHLLHATIAQGLWSLRYQDMRWACHGLSDSTIASESIQLQG